MRESFFTTRTTSLTDSGLLQAEKAEKKAKPRKQAKPGKQASTVRKQFSQTHAVLPVKLMAARCSDAKTVSPKTGPSAGKKLITPGNGREARRRKRIVSMPVERRGVESRPEKTKTATGDCDDT